MRFRASAAVLAVTSMLGLVQPAVASGLISTSNAVMVSLKEIESQGQLAKDLAAGGYTHILLSSVAATRENPHPELNPSLVNQPNEPARTGWNGTAVKDGETYQIYVSYDR
ncbi:hypothetical protein [Acidocella aromatica]|uniref:Uncharacterized protein n=1 Tax=Acidocella aromatica TaxID=1303579 RepID=A0A840VMX4_9PROT|nr:hypothetical protein [Acidocella aromatica]MBB5374475.1 hypothetical protein [Acidocella aromatica]